MTLIAILLGTLSAGIGSVWLAAALRFGLLAAYTQHMLSLAAGALLSTAFTQLLPEAFESTTSARELFVWLLLGLIFFFMLDKAELWHHGHEHHQHDREHDHDHDDRLAGRPAHGYPQPAADEVHDTAQASRPRASLRPGGGWAVLAGDSVHAFGDGILIASAFVADLRLGVVASLAVLAHEIPHHIGDLTVVQVGGAQHGTAVLKVSLAGAVTALGGLAGYGLLDPLRLYLPYFLVVAASSFIYVALADLIPQLQKRLSARETGAQIFWLAAGVVLVSSVGSLVHGH